MAGVSIMREHNNLERPYTLEFPDAISFSVHDVLNFMSLVEHPCIHDINHIDTNAESRKEFKTYLIERLLKSVITGDFELWDSKLKQVEAPPVKVSSLPTKVLADSDKLSTVDAFWRFLIKAFSRPPEPDWMQAIANPPKVMLKRRPRLPFKDDFWWATMTYILKPDLVKFCNGERINVIFESEQAGSQVTTAEFEHEKNVRLSECNVQPVNYQTALDQLVDLQSEQKPTINTYDESADGNCLHAKPKSKKQAAEKPKLVNEALKTFDALPDSGYVDVKMVAMLFGCSIPTVWRRVREGQLVAPHHPGTRTTRWQVGEIRKSLRSP